MPEWDKCGGPPARLAQSVERKALNLEVVGSSPTVGDLSPAYGASEAPRPGTCLAVSGEIKRAGARLATRENESAICCFNVFDVGWFVPMLLEVNPLI